ncbi:hypothetical protein EJV47_19195 [Hymenobacter gummosus]|uniref:Uncharacterized protein n=1 Tax=Hymenobacter gummosus TaxID=1776032 RepID=A0A3S0K3B7_9BACT|nr:hypothetical protein [Hymenobacter gummosus]RTQ47544.1 hypothetical protein EJV47_19195 [Hymenobacter gummosus]
MPRAHLAITVSQPCAENWAQMTPTVQGHHCAACAKTVVDFTQKTDAELLAWFAQPASRGTCGRFRPEQLDRPLLPPPALAPRWRSWLAAIAALWAWRTPLVLAQSPPPTVQSPPTVRMGIPSGVAGPPVQLPPLLVGQVVGGPGQKPVAGATVRLTAANVAVLTDKHGWFELRPPAPLDAQGRAWELAASHPQVRQVVVLLAAPQRPGPSGSGRPPRMGAPTLSGTHYQLTARHWSGVARRLWLRAGSWFRH